MATSRSQRNEAARERTQDHKIAEEEDKLARMRRSRAARRQSQQDRMVEAMFKRALAKDRAALRAERAARAEGEGAVRQAAALRKAEVEHYYRDRRRMVLEQLRREKEEREMARKAQEEVRTTATYAHMCRACLWGTVRCLDSLSAGKKEG